MAALAAASLLGLTACSAGSTTAGRHVDRRTAATRRSCSAWSPSRPASTSPHDDGAAIPQALLVNVYEGLVKLDQDGEIVPPLASELGRSATTA